MRQFTKMRLGALTALMIGSSSLIALPAAAAAEPIRLAQSEKPDRPQRGDRGGRPERGEGVRMDRGTRMDSGVRLERRAPTADRAVRSAVAPERRAVERRTMERRTMERRGMESRVPRTVRPDQRRSRPQPGYRESFVFLGGPRVVVRGYGPGWCRGLHRGWHTAPRIGWHGGTHRGLYRCW